jgi:altronate dehydratase small subunit
MKDNVVTALIPMEKGIIIELPSGERFEVIEKIPFAHKVALRKISRGSGVIKYGERIGRATQDIRPGEWVHIHNVVGERGKRRKK